MGQGETIMAGEQQRQVAFTEMKDGTDEDYQILAGYEPTDRTELVAHLLDLLDRLKGPLLGYPVDRYLHSLQTATRAARGGADDDMVVAALFHDIGDIIAPDNHAQVAAAILRPYVSERTYWVVLHHGIFQGYYFWHHYGGDRDARDKHRDHPHYDACVEFCRDWDQNAFDPAYDTMTLDAFLPLVDRIIVKPTDRY